MNFLKQYNLIKSVVNGDLNLLEENIVNNFSGETPLDKKLLKVLTAPAKRLRPLIGILSLRALGCEISSAQHEALLAVELIHNATLIHDDVIDNSDKRRGEKTINSEFCDNLAVTAGDYLLSVSLEKVLSTNSISVIKLYTDAMKNTCIGEINQYFSKYKVTTFDEYIEKSKGKTALLFELAVTSLLELAPNITEDKKNNAKIFAENFGIAFQIRDDLINFKNTENISQSDIKEGIYTAPVIYAVEENPNLLKSKDLTLFLNNSNCVEKTKDLMDNYFDKAAEIIKKLEESVYKKSLLDIINLLKKSA